MGNKKKSYRFIDICHAAILLTGTTLIIWAATGDLWLDEIWSIHLAEEAESPLDILLKLRHDNNHLLNTFYLLIINHPAVHFFYRIPAIISGIGTIVISAYMARTLWGKKYQTIVLILTACSYPLILYASEARGYGPVLFFSLAAAVIHYRYRKHSTMSTALLFWGCCIFGFLSHATFIIPFLAIATTAVIEQLAIPARMQVWWKKIAFIFSVPALFLLGLYVIFIRHMEFGGGPIYSRWQVAGQAASYLTGFPVTGPSPYLALLLISIITLSLSALLLKKKEWSAILFILTILIYPALLVVCTQPEFLYFRYFLVSFPFLYVLFSRLLTPLITGQNRYLKILAILVLGLYVSAQFMRIIPLLRYGRGQYTKALTTILDNSSRSPIFVGSDHDFRNRAILEFHAPSLESTKEIRYVPQAFWQVAKPQWLLYHSQDRSHTAAPTLTFPHTGQYKLYATFPFGGVSGWTWFLYKREKETSSPSAQL